MDALYIALVVVLCCVINTNSNPSGPPMSACYSMVPGTSMGFSGPEGHVTPPQNTFPGPVRWPTYYFQIHGNHSTFAPSEEFSSKTCTITLATNKYPYMNVC